jgi:two-component system, OmpR family, sensor histidine kinase BaeS
MFEKQIEQLSTVQMDGAHIRQVLHNLLTNALRHTPQGGSVTVVGRCKAGYGRRDGSRAARTGLQVLYRADKSRSRDTGGTGLGLAIVKAIVEAHDERMAVQSEGYDRGSTFSLYLPLS